MSDSTKDLTLEITDEDLKPVIDHGALLGMIAAAHAVIETADRLAAQVAEMIGVDPSDDCITDALWNMTDAVEAAQFLDQGSKPKETIQ